MLNIGLSVRGLEIEFDTARALAETVMSKHPSQVMLVAWFDRQRGKESPQVPECQHKPGWLAYAEGHGGDIRIDINNGDYIFIFSSSPSSSPSP